MKEFEFVIDENNAGERLDMVLAELIEEASRSYIQKLFSQDLIRVNGEICSSKKHIVEMGDKVEISLPDEEPSAPIPEDVPLNIQFEDEDYIVIDKPRGLVVHPAPGNRTGTIVNGLVNYLGEGYIKEFSTVCDIDRPGIVHRIDKDTSGLIVVTKTQKAYLDLASKFKAHDIIRKYYALTYNNFTEDRGTVDKPIGRNPNNRLKRAVDGIGSRQAVTHYKVVERFGRYTLIEVSLETGRTHQIRVHMAYIGHPVVGDPMYGPRKDALNAQGQVLHAGVLGFTDINGRELEFKSPLPEYFTKILQKIGPDTQ